MLRVWSSKFCEEMSILTRKPREMFEEFWLQKWKFKEDNKRVNEININLEKVIQLGKDCLKCFGSNDFGLLMVTEIETNERENFGRANKGDWEIKMERELMK